MAVSGLSGARLPKKDQEFLNQIYTDLRKSGASDTDIDKATPGLEKAIFANSRASILIKIIDWIMSATLAVVVLLGAVSLLRLIIGAGKAVEISYFWLFLAFVILLGKRLLPRFLDIGQRPGLKGLLVIIGIIGAILFGGFVVWRDIEEISIWSVVVLILSAVWVISLVNIIANWYPYAQRRILAFFRPESALVISLCKAFLAVRNQASWHDQTYRNRIAGDLAVAADAVERFMPRDVAAEAGFSSWIAVRQRFKENAIPLQEQIVWLATPGPLTRTDLEAELRKALIAVSLGELDSRLEEFRKRFPDRTPPIQAERRPWWVVVTDLCRAIAWALTPLALVQLGSAWQLPLLSEPDQQALAQKAAYIWLALAILRWLSPGNFKETIEATGTLLGRSKPKGAE